MDNLSVFYLCQIYFELYILSFYFQWFTFSMLMIFVLCAHGELFTLFTLCIIVARDDSSNSSVVALALVLLRERKK